MPTRRIAAATLALVFLNVDAAAAEDPPEPQGDKLVSGMSIVGNDEAPKSLVIVPWKSADLGESLHISDAFDDGRDPVDREVFRRKLDFYEIRRSAAEAGNAER